MKKTNCINTVFGTTFVLCCVMVFMSLISNSCSGSSKSKEVPSTEEVYGILPIQYTYDLNINKITDNIEYGEISRIIKFYYNNHNYILFGVKNSGSGILYSVVHDPECSIMDCKSQQSNYINHDTIYISKSNHIIHDTIYIKK